MFDYSQSPTSIGYTGDIATSLKPYNTGEYNLTDDLMWGATFSYGKLVGRALCSSINAQSATTGDPTAGEQGPYCWCKIIKHITNNNEQHSINSTPWTRTFTNSSIHSSCKYTCAKDCATAINRTKTFRSVISGCGLVFD